MRLIATLLSTALALAAVPAAALDFRAAADYSAARNGAAVLVMQAGQVVFEEYQNGFAPGAAHYLASGTKSFNCAIAVAAQMDGLLTLDEPVSNTIPAWRPGSPSPAPQAERKVSITARHLLSLSSGLQAGSLISTPDTFAHALNADSPYAPNEAALYGQDTFQAFAAFFQLKTGGRLTANNGVAGGRDPVEYLQARVLNPIGATLANFLRDAAGHPNMAGGAIMTARDWMRFGQLLLQNGVWEGRTVLDARLLRECSTLANPAFAGYGLSFWLNRPAMGTYQPGIDNLPGDIGTNPGGNTRIAPDVASDMFMAAGLGNQRMYMIPSLGLVVVRFADFGDWSDNEFLRRLLGTANVPAAPHDYQDLWWAGASEDGWGMSLTQKGATLFAGLYVYDAAGRPYWSVMSGCTWNALFTECSGPLYTPTGTPYFAYDASRLVLGAPVGSATLAFSDGNRATLSYSWQGQSGQKAITRQTFAAGIPRGNLTDLWWGGPSQNGWGAAITQQGETAFAVWYTYDEQGRATWFVIPDGRVNASGGFEGTLYRASGAPWIGVAYDASRFVATSAGTFSFATGSDGRATMRYRVDGRESVETVVRQPF